MLVLTLHLDTYFHTPAWVSQMITHGIPSLEMLEVPQLVTHWFPILVMLWVPQMVTHRIPTLELWLECHSDLDCQIVGGHTLVSSVRDALGDTGFQP